MEQCVQASSNDVFRLNGIVSYIEKLIFIKPKNSKKNACSVVI